MKRCFIYLIALIFTILPVLFNTQSVNAESESEFIPNMESSDIDELFDLRTEDIVNPMDWISERYTYSVLEKNNGKEYYWINTPNLQQIIYNRFTSIIPTGYMGSGSIPSENSRIIEIPKKDRAKTGMQKYGFMIPNPPYIGETPRVDMSIGGVIVENNPIKFVYNKIKGFLFRDSYIEAPEMSTYESLRHMSHDYAPSSDSFENWIDLYWDTVVGNMDEAQIIISGADEEGVKDGVQYVKQTVLVDNDLHRVKTNSRDLNDELREVLGPEYNNVIFNIINIGLDSGDAKPMRQDPVRFMPYDKDTLRSEDAKSLVEDPRVERQTKIGIGGFNVRVGLDKLIASNTLGSVVDIAGLISEATVALNSVTTFSTIEDMGFDIIALWESPITQIVAVMIMVGLVITLVGHIYRIASGSGSLMDALGSTLISFTMLGIVFAMLVSPNSMYQSVKTFSSVFMNLGSEIISYDDNVSVLNGNGNSKEKADNMYWLPYFSLWTDYNLSKSMSDRSMKLTSELNLPEEKDIIIPKIGDRDAKVWNAILAESFTSGSRIDNQAYRAVDHFMAPRLTVDSPPNLFKTKMNENYSKSVQHTVDIGMFLMIVILFFGVLIKLILFLEFIYYLAMAPINLALSVYKKGAPKQVGKEFLASFFRVGIWDIILSLVVFVTMTITGGVSLLLAVMMILGFIYGVRQLAHSGSVFAPNFLKSIRGYI